MKGSLIERSPLLRGHGGVELVESRMGLEMALSPEVVEQNVRTELYEPCLISGIAEPTWKEQKGVQMEPKLPGQKWAYGGGLSP